LRLFSTPYNFRCHVNNSLAKQQERKMKNYQEPAKTIPILTETDILVVGAGPSGLSAAIAAAREGVKTVLVERYGCFGGVLSQVGVEGIAWYRHKKTVEANGIGNEFEKRAAEFGGTAPEPQSDSEAIDAEMFKVVADVMVGESGIIPILHSWAVEAIVENGVIKGVITESKSGRQAIIAKRVIDCTGDADVAVLAGVPYTKAPKDRLMAVTQMFSCRGVDKEKFEKFVNEKLKPTYKDWGGKSWAQSDSTGDRDIDMFSPFMEGPFYKAQEDGYIPREENVFLGGTWSTLSHEGDATQLNMIFMKNIDCTDVWDLTKSEIAGRRNALYAIKALNKYVPGFEKARLRNFGLTLGARESRQIEGRYSLTGHDVYNQAKFEDSIGIFPEFIDGKGHVVLPTTGRYFQVPYGSLVPREVDNLLVAGRSISGDETAHCAFRNMMCCTVSGQGAGTAAAASIKAGVSTADVDIRTVQDLLRLRGVRVD
jgi:ribulose 1,5-bisphosphate synthetase/thiazole synthase